MTGFGYNVNGFGAYYDREVTVTASNASSVNLQTIFNNALPNSWISTIVKRYVIPSDVVLGITTVPASMAGTLIIDNSGDIQGTGGDGGTFAGTPTGSAGGTAMTVQSTGVTINMLSGSTLSGGGGGGGGGGQGGNGRFLGGGNLQYAPGGAGGDAGQGIGYNQSQANGSAGGGVSHENAGSGGTGGNGATGFGAAGSTGSNGNNGNWTNGASGGAGGAAGRAITFSGVSAYTIIGTDSGTINGAYT